MPQQFDYKQKKEISFYYWLRLEEGAIQKKRENIVKKLERKVETQKSRRERNMPQMNFKN